MAAATKHNLAYKKIGNKKSAPAALTPRAARALSLWFKGNRRTLPWRTHPRSFYATAVSEIMLQQTQVVTMLPFYTRWMQRLPSFSALAAADEAVVLKLWEGLGYYSRARNLRKLAQAVVAQNLENVLENKRGERDEAGENGESIAKTLQALPGIGPYTSAAIASLVYGEAAAVVDGNVVRVLARMQGMGTEFKNAAAAVKATQPLAAEFLNAALLANEANGAEGEPAAEAGIAAITPGMHNEALMELGARICTKHTPACSACPVRTHCIGFKKGEAFVARTPAINRAKTIQRTVQRAWVQQGAAVLLQLPANVGEGDGPGGGQQTLNNINNSNNSNNLNHKKDTGRLRGMYALPELDVLKASVAEAVGENIGGNYAAGGNGCGIIFKRGPLLAKKMRGISNERITEHIYNGNIALAKGSAENNGGNEAKNISNISNVPNVPNVLNIPINGFEWVRVEAIEAILLSGPHRKWIDEFLKG